MRARQTCFGVLIGVLVLGLSPVGAAESDTDTYAAAPSDRPVLFLPAPYKRALDTREESNPDLNLNGPPNDTERSVRAPGLSRGAYGEAAELSVRTSGSRHGGEPYPPNLLSWAFDLGSGGVRLSSPEFSVLRGLDRDAYNGAWALTSNE